MGSTAGSGRIPSRIVIRLGLLLTVLLVVSGCSRLAFWDDPPAPQPEATVQETETPPPEEELEEEPQASQLDEAFQHYNQGDFELAARSFEETLGGFPSLDPQDEAQALWSLAMIHILPESPIQDQGRAMELLDRLASEHHESIRGAQARWLLSTMEELETIRAQATQQEELVQQLTETVEQLRRIDLNRRPTGGGTRPDTLRPPPQP